MRTSIRIVALCVAGASLFMATGCPYSTQSGLPQHIRTVEVPMFRNQKTMYKGLETKLTAAIIDRLQNDPQVRVVNGNANATIKGEIIDVERKIYRETRKDKPASVRVTVTIRYSFIDNVEQRAIITEKTLQSSESSSTAGLYEVDRGEVQATAEDEAIDVLAKEVVRHTVGMW